MPCYFCIFCLIEAVTKTNPISRKEEMSLPFAGERQVSGKASGIGTIVPFIGKHNLLKSTIHSLYLFNISSSVQTYI